MRPGERHAFRVAVDNPRLFVLHSYKTFPFLPLHLGAARRDSQVQGPRIISLRVRRRPLGKIRTYCFVSSDVLAEDGISLDTAF